MADLIAVVLPFVSVLIGAGLTYAFSVRQQRRSRVEDVFHDAIAAVAVAHASHDFLTQMGAWRGASPDEYAAFTSELGREGNLNYVRAVANARSALARASAYDPTLREYLGATEDVYERADVIQAHLRRRLGAA